ncbi:Rdx family protein [bacterium]|nr:Rdx family protein [bacterium]
MAASLAEELQREFDTKPELIASSGGVFEVTVDGTLVYSKKKTGRHIRDNREVVDLIREMQDA